MKRIRSLFLFAALTAASTLCAQTKIVRMHLADGTSKYTCISGLEKISFLGPDVTDKGLTLNLTDGSKVGVLFCDEPAITFTDGGFTLSSTSLDNPVSVTFENVSDITLGATSSIAGVEAVNKVICEINAGEVLFHGIPEGVGATVYSIDGRTEGVYPSAAGEISLSRTDFTPGVHIVKIGSYTAKIIF